MAIDAVCDFLHKLVSPQSISIILKRKIILFGYIISVVQSTNPVAPVSLMQLQSIGQLILLQRCLPSSNYP